jgi:hypothetical protein
MITKKVSQINNLRIQYSPKWKQWLIITPDKAILEGFRNLNDAKAFARRTKDFMRKK